VAKGNLMMQARLQYGGRLDFVEVDDFERPGRLQEAVQGVDAVIHVASVRSHPTAV
jgi:nucleoside-diphosphate-sugar epimerase